MLEKVDEDIVDVVSVIEETVQEDLIVTTITTELVPFEGLLGWNLV